MTAIPVLARLFFIAIGIGLLTTGVIVTIRKRHEGWVGIRAGAFLMVAAFVLGVSFNSLAFAKNDYQQDATQETATSKAFEWYEKQNQEVRRTLASWVVDFVTD